MFKNPFSFEGRIRRLEYGLSYLIYMVALGAIQALGAEKNPVLFLILLPGIWFLVAQGAKRCHDRGNSGWYQLIPFYGFWMLFADGEPGPNEYGPNPKRVSEMTEKIEA